MKTVYLAGPITGLQYEEAQGWRDQIQAKLAPGISVVNPMRGKEYLQGTGELKDAYDHPLEGDKYPPPMSTPSAIVNRDFFDVSNCDLVCMNLLGAKIVSIGSVVECGWSHRRTPLIVIMELEDNVHDHAFINEVAAWRVETIDEAVMIINATLSAYA